MDKSENTNTVSYKESIEDIYKEIKILKDEIKKLNNFIYEKEEKMKKVIEEKDILINEI
jgi:prefoldin subunit 5